MPAAPSPTITEKCDGVGFQINTSAAWLPIPAIPIVKSNPIDIRISHSLSIV
jgi:hypothetical protein